MSTVTYNPGLVSGKTKSGRLLVAQGISEGFLAKTKEGFSADVIVAAEKFRGLLYWEHTGRAATGEKYENLQSLEINR